MCFFALPFEQAALWFLLQWLKVMENLSTLTQTRYFYRNSAKDFLRALCNHCFEEYEPPSFLFITNLISLPYLRSSSGMRWYTSPWNCRLLASPHPEIWRVREGELPAKLAPVTQYKFIGTSPYCFVSSYINFCCKSSAVSLFQLCLCEHLRNMSVEENAVHMVLLCRVTLPQQADEKLPNPMSRQTGHPQKQDTYPCSLPARDFPADNGGGNSIFWPNSRGQILIACLP